MAALPAYSSYEHFNITNPSPFVAHVEINRPRQLNAFSRPVWLEFGAVFRQLSRDADVRVVVLTGSGERAFCSGLDVKSAAQDPVVGSEEKDPARWANRMRPFIEEFQECISAMEKCEKPVICVLHGVCLGLAIDISCCADIRLASTNAIFSVKEVDIGMAADVGTLARLPRIVGSSTWVKDVCLTARNFPASEAASMGFVSSPLYDDKAAAVDAALGIAGTLAEKSPVAVQGTKELLNHGREHGVAEALRYTAVWNSVMLQAGDFKKALGAGLAKRKPTFEKL